MKSKLPWGVLIVRGAPVVLGALQGLRARPPAKVVRRRRPSGVILAAVGLVLGVVAGYLLGTRLLPSARVRRPSPSSFDSSSREELYKRAQAEDVSGRSTMSKQEFQDALGAGVQ